MVAMYIWIQTSYFKESLTNLMQLKLQSYLYLVVSLVIYCMFGNLWKMVWHEFFMVNTAWKKLMLSYLYLWHFKKEIQTYFRDSKMTFVHTISFYQLQPTFFHIFFFPCLWYSHMRPRSWIESWLSGWWMILVNVLINPWMPSVN